MTIPDTEHNTEQSRLPKLNSPDQPHRTAPIDHIKQHTKQPGLGTPNSPDRLHRTARINHTENHGLATTNSLYWSYRTTQIGQTEQPGLITSNSPDRPRPKGWTVPRHPPPPPRPHLRLRGSTRPRDCTGGSIKIKGRFTGCISFRGSGRVGSGLIRLDSTRPDP